MKMTRGDVVKAAVKAFSSEMVEATGDVFADVRKSNRNADYIETAYQAGWVKGNRRAIASQEQQEDAINRMLSHGSDGPDVKLLQEILKEKGYYLGKIHSIYDKLTENAVERYQRSLGILASGNVGSFTLKKINELAANMQSAHGAAEEELVFRPNQLVNRVEALKIFLEALGADTSARVTTSFDDTSGRAWYMKYVNFAVRNGIMSGYGNKRFGPEDTITNAQMAKILSGLMER